MLSHETTIFHQAGRKLRDLGTSELTFYLASLGYPRHYCVAAEIEGDLLPDDFQPAFHLVQRRHPLLNVEIRPGSAPDAAPAFYTISKPIDLTLEPLDHDDDWRREAERQMSEAFDASPGPLMRATVFYRLGRIQVVLTFHHAIADGMSGIDVMRDLLTALAGHPLDLLTPPPSFETLAPEIPNFSASMAAQPIIEFEPEALRAIGVETVQQFRGAPRPKVSSLSLGEPLTRRIQKIAKARGATVNDVLAAAYVLSGLEARPAAAYSILSPVDLRGTLNVEDHRCAVYMTWCRYEQARAGGDTFWEIAHRVNREIAVARSAPGIAGMMKVVQTNIPSTADAEMVLGFVNALQYDGILSNLGRLHLAETVGRLRLAAVWGPVTYPADPGTQFIGVATFGNCLRLVETRAENVTSLLEPISRKLKQAVAGSV